MAVRRGTYLCAASSHVYPGWHWDLAVNLQLYPQHSCHLCALAGDVQLAIEFLLLAGQLDQAFDLAAAKGQLDTFRQLAAGSVKV